MAACWWGSRLWPTAREDKIALLECSSCPSAKGGAELPAPQRAVCAGASVVSQPTGVFSGHLQGPCTGSTRRVPGPQAAAPPRPLAPRQRTAVRGLLCGPWWRRGAGRARGSRGWRGRFRSRKPWGQAPGVAGGSRASRSPERPQRLGGASACGRGLRAGPAAQGAGPGWVGRAGGPSAGAAPARPSAGKVRAGCGPRRRLRRGGGRRSGLGVWARGQGGPERQGGGLRPPGHGDLGAGAAAGPGAGGRERGRERRPGGEPVRPLAEAAGAGARCGGPGGAAGPGGPPPLCGPRSSPSWAGPWPLTRRGAPEPPRAGLVPRTVFRCLCDQPRMPLFGPRDPPSASRRVPSFPAGRAGALHRTAGSVGQGVRGDRDFTLPPPPPPGEPGEHAWGPKHLPGHGHGGRGGGGVE